MGGTKTRSEVRLLIFKCWAGEAVARGTADEWCVFYSPQKNMDRHFLSEHPFCLTSSFSCFLAFSLSSPQDRQGASFTPKIMFPDDDNSSFVAHLTSSHPLLWSFRAYELLEMLLESDLGVSLPNSCDLFLKIVHQVELRAIICGFFLEIIWDVRRGGGKNYISWELLPTSACIPSGVFAFAGLTLISPCSSTISPPSSSCRWLSAGLSLCWLLRPHADVVQMDDCLPLWNRLHTIIMLSLWLPRWREIAHHTGPFAWSLWWS